MKLFYYCLLACLLPVLALGQQISGTVLDEQRQALPAITVSIKGTGIVRITDEKGHFTIPAPAGPVTLRFTGVGFEIKELPWTGEKELTVSLRPSRSSLDEVQVIAYGTNTQRYNTGSVTRVTAADIARQPVSNPLSALQGRVPGLVVTSSSGLPGASVNLQIRGQNTLRPTIANIQAPRDNPLFIVDGVPFATGNGNINQYASAQSPGQSAMYNNSYGGISPFSSIDPQDIESIEVLRDADATAIYGSRGGNGVILITTKKGKAGITKIDLNLNSGLSFTGRTMQMMNTTEYLAMRREAMANDGVEPNLIRNDEGYAPDLLLFDQHKSTDWRKYFTGNQAAMTNANLSISGGNAQTTFHLSGGYNRESYIFPGDFAGKRGNMAVNLHHGSSGNRLSLDFSAGYSAYRNNSSGARELLGTFGLDPNYPDLLDGNGNLVWNYKGQQLSNYPSGNNVLAYLRQPYRVSNNLLTSNLLAAYKIARGLTFRTSFGYTTFNGGEYRGTPKSTLSPYNNPQATASFGTNNYRTWIIEPQLEYRGYTGKHTYSALIGGTFQQNNNERTDATGTGYLSDELIGSIAGAPNRTITDAYSGYKYQAIFGRLTYRYDERYLLNVSVRRDGSSRFGPDRRFGNFGAIGAGWLFAEESFLKDHLPWLSYGKLRGSYGITGSDQIGDYGYLSRWATGSYFYDGALGYLPRNLFNNRFGWATTKKLEAGLELGFFKDRILTNVTWYRNRTGNQLVSYRLPSQSGFTTVTENLDALVQNSGWEFTLQGSPVKKETFTWTASMNLTIPRNKLVAFPGLAASSYNNQYFIGQPLNVVRGYRYAGVNPETGLFEFFGADGTRTSTPVSPSGGSLNDQAVTGHTDPKWYGGLQNSFRYRSLQLDVFVEFRKQWGTSYLKQIYSNLPGFEQNLPVAFNQRWQKPGDQAPFQRLSVQYGEAYDAGSAFFESSGVYGDASYARLKNVALSWQLPAKFLNRLHLQHVRVYANAQNLLTITDYAGNDPETQNFYGVPPLKTVVLGLQLTL
ncbi:SusC/RagA family TonB-linked outer membrane protein [Mucilaginibacter roseus]|uniref:SusC/RagA family TonB-linked outer membrane protein n=1 Tax=Mucilaginibacter roseus TaxID=1528868 RepID=A0ABS8TZH9_9SPHI|nr:SusC/RagA family TonB-linked outer membrane protein [Mucilaginibacter roseus]MCD8739064.1 SusC/RagA family TonB-linked outer membrane protein [Mucilaginibacter roseus]